MKQLRFLIFVTILICLAFTNSIFAQRVNYKPQNLPFADQKLYHLGFFIGMNFQDMTMKNTGYTDQSGHAWFSEVPSYTPGFTVGILADRYLSQYFNLRFAPALHFGEKKYTFVEQKTQEKYSKSLKTNYLYLPFSVKFSAIRKHNFRPYMIAGAYTSINLSNKSNEALNFKTMDYGLEFGLGCNIYLPLFKLCPELKFSLGLANLINRKESDLTDIELLPYRRAVSTGRNKMISLVFNFE